jgi:hypothetical protein
MEDNFEVSDPHNDARDGHVNFTIHDGATKIPARISGQAMRILADDSGFSPVEVFKANQRRIRTAAYKVRRFYPTLAIVVLGSGDFS